MLAVSEHGHARWERLFEPDWSRFWRLNDVYCNDTASGETLDITFAGDQIMGELYSDAHSMFGLDPRTPVQQVECCTEFGVQVTFWKVMATVKRVQWRGTSVSAELKELMRTYSPGDSRVASLIRSRVSRRLAAIQCFTRLSSKWTCSADALTNRDGCLPELRLGTEQV